MSHKQQLQFVEQIRRRYPSHFTNSTVLEVGSLDINGSVRPLFNTCRYIGIDVGPGPGVDLVCEGQNYDSEPVDVTISCECFEHNPYWKETFNNMIRLTRSGGLVILTCATTGRKEHGTAKTTPNDSPLTIAKGWTYYQNLTEDDIRSCCALDQLFSFYCFDLNLHVSDLYFYGIKT